MRLAKSSCRSLPTEPRPKEAIFPRVVRHKIAHYSAPGQAPCVSLGLLRRINQAPSLRMGLAQLGQRCLGACHQRAPLNDRISDALH
jgi:hypothetical protein